MQRLKIRGTNRVYVVFRDVDSKRTKSTTVYDVSVEEAMAAFEDAIDREERRGKRKDAKP